jgi:DNA-binding response OmpR family regulator
MKPLLLLAESDAELAGLYRQFLTRHGYAVETATDGLECLAILRCFLPDVLVLDVEILWGGGDGVLACLTEEDGRPAVPVVLTGTAASAAALDRYRALPGVFCLEKPFSLSALLERVRAAVTRGPALSRRGRQPAVILRSC